MITNIINNIFGNLDAKKLKKYNKDLVEIKKIEAKIKDFDHDDILNQTQKFKALFADLDFNNPEDSQTITDTLESIKYEAFATVRKACELMYDSEYTLSNGEKLTWKMIPYDVQIIGGLCIHDGNISEMKTGEGKTLVATMPAYLNALTGNTVHIVTVNDYLAKRDSVEMGVLYEYLGLSCGVVYSQQDNGSKKENYQKDVVYATNNELGFDYLRDNMVTSIERRVQSPLFYCIIDEIDSILIDEARTPLIISMPDSEPTTKYLKFATLVQELVKNTHYKIDEKQKTATLTEEGIEKIEKLLGVKNIYVSERYNDIHHIENALKANTVYEKDKDYLVAPDGEILIIDEHTGRTLSGRRYSEGLHQAIEAKEGVEIKQESKTLASITFQNFFRMYWKLSGMTGTAKTEEEEFYKVYGLETVAIPTNKPIIRDDRKDMLFKNEKGKFNYVVNLIKKLHEKGQPVLVGTVSVQKSEYLSDLLTKAGIKHNVLNAKQNAREAEIVEAAGQYGAVTIATNMAGRGTDIKLGEGVRELGGLAIIGTEKHETRRIDNQLRGRAGRQGDPGMTQFLISPTDDIMRIFGGDKLFGIFNTAFASLPDDEPLSESRMLTGKITGVQKQVEGHNFDIRKHVLEYDDVINKHREIIYNRRNKILASEDIHQDVKDMVYNQVTKFINGLNIEENTDENKSIIIEKVNNFLDFELINEKIEFIKVEDNPVGPKLTEYIANLARNEVSKILERFDNEEDFYTIERRLVLQSIDRLWMNHIDAMSKLREQVAFEGYAQRNPLVTYKERAFEKFQLLVDEIEFKVVKALFSLNVDSIIEQKRIRDEMLKVQSENPNAQSGSQAAASGTSSSQKVNPLFRNPAAQAGTRQTKQSKENKTKIRV